ncbi:MAG: NAD(P)-binding domain-containing protein [Candidatus Eremiobacteraeota bacterium]|nr:NAD(P)-binding domain-containing protein [Candidatus Eremiobacteraeota bacterium]
MKIGFIGAGKVAQTFARYFLQHGHEVVLSNSRGPESLDNLAKTLGPKARAASVQEAADQELVILAVRWPQAEQALAQVPDWNGRILVDATNRPLDQDATRTASEVIADYAPGARLVKALNTLVVDWIEDDADPKPELVLFLSGDDAEAKQKLAAVLQPGFFPVDLGGLVAGGKLQQFGGPLSGLHLDLIKQLKF